jgi:hypothetical protein
VQQYFARERIVRCRQLIRICTHATLTAAMAACSAICQINAWISWTTWGGDVSLRNSQTGESRSLRQASGGRTSHCAFSNDGRRLTFAQSSGSVYVVNNDGTGLAALCNTYTSNEVTNICWTLKGIFWMEGTAEGGSPYVYWADPQSGTTRRLGPVSRGTPLTSLSMTRDGSLAYARLHHESVGFAYGAMFFGIDAGATALVGQKYDDAGEWDHGAVMLNDGSAALWTLWDCSSFGNSSAPDPGSCYHHAFGYVVPSTSTTGSFDKQGFTDWQVLHDRVQPAVPYDWQLWGPGSSPFTTPSNDSLVIYTFQQPVDPWACRTFIWNIHTNDITDVTPPNWAYEGEFWVGDLPDPHSTGTAQPWRAPPTADVNTSQAGSVAAPPMPFALDGRRLAVSGVAARAMYIALDPPGNAVGSRRRLRVVASGARLPR